MVVENVHFDEVFDVAAHGGNFSFRSRGRTEYGVRLSKQVVPAAGSTFAVALARPGDWSTVLGWRDLASNQIVLVNPTWAVWLGGLADIALYGTLILVGALLLAGLGGVLAVAAAFAGILLYQTRRNRTIKRALLDAVAAPGR